MRILLFFISGSTCHNLLPPQYGSLSTDLALSGTEVIASCDEGYWFPDNSSELVVFCDEDKHWNGSITDCKGRMSVAHKARNHLFQEGHFLG